MKNLKSRIAAMNFLEFAVWGAYLTSMGNYLGKAGMGAEIAWFYAIQGIVSIFMPTIMGIIADKFIQPQRLLGICHLLAGAGMVGLFMLGEGSATPDKTLFIAIYAFSVSFYMPTLALSNTAAFVMLKENGYDTVKDFPPIRVLGTVGFIATMWFVNCAVFADDVWFTLGDNAAKFQYTHFQFLVSGVLSLVLFAYCFTMPQCKLVAKESQSIWETLGFTAFRLFKTKRMALFFIFSMFLGMSLQVTNGFATPFLTHFQGLSEFADTFAANNATLLVSISQVAEALCILLIPFFLKRYGIKTVMLIAMFAWVGRFGFLGLGDPGFPGVILFILSCLVYGVAFDFFNVSGGLFVDQECDAKVRASAQGLFMLMTNGLGATIGTLIAGQVVNHYCSWQEVVINGKTTSLLIGEWSTPWFIFAAYALVVAVTFMLVFKDSKQSRTA